MMIDMNLVTMNRVSPKGFDLHMLIVMVTMTPGTVK